MKNSIFTDACILGDLYNLGLLNSLFSLDFHIHTTSIALFHLTHEQQLILKNYQLEGVLIIHTLNESDFQEVYTKNYPLSLSEMDKSIIFFANKFNTGVLSSCQQVQYYLKNKSVDLHGVLWVLDRLIEKNIISNYDASIAIQNLTNTNFVFRQNKPILAETNKRLKVWSIEKADNV